MSTVPPATQAPTPAHQHSPRPVRPAPAAARTRVHTPSAAAPSASLTRGAAAPTAAAPAASPVPTGWLPEVQGLRTLALLLVATFHIWFDRVSGGVDIFLLISAFLMTRSLYARLERGTPLRPVSYIVQRFARLMPLSITIAALILVVSLVVLPVSRFGAHVEQFVASALYVENRWLQDALVDYFSNGLVLASPFQHYWSLAIQAQVFVLWPLIFGLMWLVRRRWNVPLRPMALWVFGTIFVAGLAWSTVLTAVDQQYAYLDLSARLWEFAAGSVLALVLPFIRLRAGLRGVLAWIGIAGAVLCGVVIPVDGTFPGVVALWPVLSAALVIVGAGARTRFGGDRLLAHPVLTRIGSYTYALYLVHWPVLIIGMALLRTDHPDLLEGAAYLAVSAVISVVAVHVVEKPVAAFTHARSSTAAPDAGPAGLGARQPGASRLGAPQPGASGLGVPPPGASGLGARQPGASGRGATPRIGRTAGRHKLRATLRRVPWRAATVVALIPAAAIGTGAWGDTVVEANRTEAQLEVYGADLSTLGPNLLDITPAVAADPAAIPGGWVDNDIGVLFGCHDHMLPAGSSDRALEFCQSNINIVNRDEADRSVYVVGNSHAMQLAQFVNEAARHEGWAVRGHLQHGCQFGGYAWIDENWRETCMQMWADATLDIRENRPDAVVVLASWSESPDVEHELPGLTDWISEITAEGIDVIAIRDNPRSDLHMIECAERWGSGSDRCQWSTALTSPNDELRATVANAGGVYLDLNEQICPGGVCRPQIGGVVVFFDDDHLTATFMRALAYTAAPTLAADVAWWPERLGGAHLS